MTTYSIIKIRKPYRLSKIALAFLFIQLAEMLCPLSSFALTSGPSQPEVQGFEPVGTSEVVDLFSGDFTYNIPLLELPGSDGGYPFNLAYHSGVSMDQEASWVGLGWSLNPGAIVRNMRGVPDDFKGEEITQELDIKKNFTVGANLGVNVELWSYDFMKGSANLSLSLGMQYNSYRGISMSTGADISSQITPGGDVSCNNSAGISLSSDDGAGFNMSTGVSGDISNKAKTFNNSLGGGISLGVNSRSGITNIGLNANWSRKASITKSATKNKKNNSEVIGRSVGGSGTISFSQVAYTPSSAMDMKGKNISGSIKVGGDLGGAFTDFNIGVNYSDQELKNKNVSNPAYGYVYSKDATSNNRSIMDVNREKDGSINKFSSNLAVPSATYDILSVQGQGVGGMYRPFRNDIGVYADNYSESKYSGGGFGFDIGLGYPQHIGLSGDINFSESRSGKYENENAWWSFTNTDENKNYENVYFRSLGEMTSEDQNRIQNYIGGVNPQYIELTGNRTDPSISGDFRYDISNKVTGMYNNTDRKNDLNRRPRNMPIQGMKTADINEYNIKEYKTIKYFNTPNNYTPANQVTYNHPTQSSQFGGYSVYNSDGSRYVYGIPAMNTKHKEANFSVAAERNNCDMQKIINEVQAGDKPNYKIKGTDEYYSRKSIPPYAHSYLLTSILGHDYIDLTGDGPSSDDFGYWVKFNYVKTSGNYKWRSPYKGNEVNWMKGHNIDINDDKGSYMYGEKENWYLATAETKTHIVVFEISERMDARDAMSELSTSAGVGSNKSYKLDKIKLYNRDDYYSNPSSAIPIKTVYMEYSYDLCPNVPNNSMGSDPMGSDNTNHGKLTLKKVYFSYENSTKATHTPYEFTYSNFNPAYDQNANDRWGNYKPTPTEACLNNDLPYVDQDLAKITRDNYSQAWNLTEIDMPSGAHMKVTYEAKDYSYVQDLEAMQMVPIYSLSDQTAGNKDRIYPDAINGWNCSDDDDRKVYFNLQEPLINTSSIAQQKAEALKYVDERKQLSFKLLVYMQKPGEQRCKEWVTGYVDIQDWGIDAASDNGTNFTRGYFILKKPKIGRNEKNYHPFTLAALQKLRYDVSKYAYNDIDIVTEMSEDDGATQIANSLARMFGSFKELFTNYYMEKVATGKQWSAQIDLNKSRIRVKNIKGHKYGGGNRVAKIELIDNWNASSGEQNATYGQTYDYNTVDGKSSGVAAYEPTIGGEEIPQRCYKPSFQKVSVNTFQNTFFEYPINESYYPGASIGYSRVTVKSLNTDKVMRNDGDYGFSTTGFTVSEFYTYKDYPIITRETVMNPNLDEKNPAGDRNSSTMMYSSIPIPLPGFGSLSFNSFAASQGYSIELNDMHGKAKAVYNYGLDNSGQPKKGCLSSVEYKYYEQVTDVIDPVTKKKNTKRVLNSNVPVLVNDIDPNDHTRALIDNNRNVGLDYEFFTDMRETYGSNAGGGLSFNIELATPVPFPFPWPNINFSENKLKVMSTNKVIHRVGILKQTIATDGQSRVMTDNVCFDALTGRPLLTTVTNNYDHPIYSYTIPAYWKYDGLGASYKELNYSFKVLGETTADGEVVSGTTTVYHASDEVFVDDNSGRNYYRVYSNHVQDISIMAEVYLSGNPNKFIVVDKGPEYINMYYTGHTINPLSIVDGGDMVFTVFRPGRRNHLTVDAGTITALKDPTKDRSLQSCTQDLYGNTNIGSLVSNSGTNICFNQGESGFLLNLNTITIPGTYSFAHGSTSFPGATFMYTPLWNRLIAAGYNTIQYTSDNRIVISNSTGSVLPIVIAFFDNLGNAIPLSSIDYIPYSENYTTSPIDLPGYQFAGYKFNNSTGEVYMYTINGSLLCESNPNSPSQYESFATITNHEQIVLDSVLSASATTYSSIWNQDFSDLRFPNGEFYKIADVANADKSENGEGTIWRKMSDFVYYTDRDQIDPNQVTTSRDGTFSLKMFDWFAESMNYLCNSLWVKVNEITRYNPYNNETENKDALENRSAALYSYKGKLPIAVAANAKYVEIGNENFEEYQIANNGIPFHMYNQFETSTGNLTFAPRITTITTSGGGTVTRYHKVPFSYTVEGASAIIYSGEWTFGSSINDVRVVIERSTTPISWDYSPDRVQTVNIISVNESWPDSPIPNAIALGINIPINVESSSSNDGLFLSGYLEIPYQEVIPTSTSISNTDLAMEVVNSKAHTGRQCMKLMSDISFTQDNLQLNSTGMKSYEFSSWISRNNTKLITYKQNNTAPNSNVGVRIEGYSRSGTLLYTSDLIQPKGSIINGWQKMEGSFAISNPTVAYVKVHVYIGGDELYMDDIRIFPSDAEMKSYVYNKLNYRYMSELDNNNYASYYYYDEQGQLFLVKKETAEGIKTIQETRSSTPLKP